ncbi:large subunit ribosomal protein L25 [Clostridium collagenovorans DSM 3089]|uniref:Large subunit ribosomal protein L25 n=1 Tax=Clostridium collagenovorans DSM 3089 TaxID=1121306 RepID=A0A1M5XXW2_9CLOT|nr:50S ribosomal protein L25 [Clostridium collagenovorans]SHI04562.1 large subunit ribosomal protein L25 [Clostridium collagenovorans DSM 3089]
MENVLVKVFEREEKACRLKNSEFLPGVVYGREIQSKKVKVNKKEIFACLLENGERALVNLLIDGVESLALIRSVGRNPGDGTIIHIDFQVVDEEDVITRKVPISYVGKKMLKSKGLYLQKCHTTVEVEGMVKRIPERFIVDLSSRNLGENITVKSLNLGEGLKAITAIDKALAVVSRL